VKEKLGDPPEGVKDPQILDWCAEHGAVWLTTDIAAKKQHGQSAKQRRISAVWYHQPKQGWSTRQQHWVITKFLERICRELASGDAVHFRVGAGEKARLLVEWRTPRGHLL